MTNIASGTKRILDEYKNLDHTLRLGRENQTNEMGRRVRLAMTILATTAIAVQSLNFKQCRYIQQHIL